MDQHFQIATKKVILSVLTCSLLLTTGFARGEAYDGKGVKHYLKKYSGVEISAVQENRLTDYDYLIDYFCEFDFFAPKHKVNPDFLRALILAESAGIPQARSQKDARGLTQIIYATGKQAAHEILELNIEFQFASVHKLRKLKPDDLYDPAINILLACYLIAKYNHSFDGKLDLVVSAWNAGENSIVNNTPPNYSETLDLIGKVNGFYISLLKKNSRMQRYAYRR
ncbi:MAG: lytic transglycosylase domain-containing protein [Desulfobulbaceae bacterium]|nr:lytic transglycosylase domain-containing protein [Desulfobulbaceae bacterium]